MTVARPKKKSGGKQTPRQRMLAAIHICKNRLDLDDEEYRDLLQTLTGKRSAKDCSQQELRTIMDGFRKMGCKPPAPAEDSSAKKQIGKMRLLWRDLSDAGKLSKQDTSLNSWVYRQFRIQRAEWLSARQKSQAIEQMKQWLARN